MWKKSNPNSVIQPKLGECSVAIPRKTSASQTFTRKGWIEWLGYLTCVTWIFDVLNFRQP